MCLRVWDPSTTDRWAWSIRVHSSPILLLIPVCGALCLWILDLLLLLSLLWHPRLPPPTSGSTSSTTSSFPTSRLPLSVPTPSSRRCWTRMTGRRARRSTTPPLSTRAPTPWASPSSTSTSTATTPSASFSVWTLARLPRCSTSTRPTIARATRPMCSRSSPRFCVWR